MTRRRHESRAIDSFLDLNEGDLVVHVSHGIARYRGMQFLEKNGRARRGDLILEFAGGPRSTSRSPRSTWCRNTSAAARPTGAVQDRASTWEKRKKRVAEAVLDLARRCSKCRPAPASRGSPIRRRQRLEGRVRGRVPLRGDARSAHGDRGDQAGHGQQQPMDRLICGDVGYGKTELAIRAAFKAVDAGKQVAVLVPTTVLAEQHYRTFSARMAEYPFVVESSAGSGPARGREVLKRAGEGGLDIIIGTHRSCRRTWTSRTWAW